MKPTLMFSRFFGRPRAEPSHEHVSSVRFRILEGGIALFCLLLLLQIFWLFMRSPNWQSAAGPRSGIYVKGWSRMAPWFPSSPLFRSWDPSTASVHTAEPLLHVTIFAPADTVANLSLNGSPKMSKQVGSFPLEADVNLRRGANGIIVSSPHYNVAPWFGTWWLWAPGFLTQLDYPVTRVHYDPANHLDPKIIGILPLENEMCGVLGLWDPDIDVRMRVSDSKSFWESKTDGMGAFLMELRKPTEATNLTLSSLAETSATSVNIAASCPASFTNAVSLQRRVFLDFADNQPNIRVRARVPGGTAIYEWIKERQITSGELLNDLFNLTVTDSSDSDGHFDLKEVPEGIEVVLNQKIVSEHSLIHFWGNGRIPFPLTSNDEIKVDGVDTVEFESDAPPSTTGNMVSWSGLSGKRLNFLTIHSRQSNLADERVDERISVSALTGGSLSAIEGNLPAFVRAILWILLTALPFIWLLSILGANPYKRLPRYASTLFAATVAFLLFHLTVLSQPLFVFSLAFLDRVPFERWLSHWFGAEAAVQYARSLYQMFTDLGRTYPFLVIGMCVLIRPIFRAYNGKISGRVTESVGLRVVRWLAFWPSAILLPLPLLAGLFAYYVAVQSVFWRKTSLAELFLAHYGTLQIVYTAVAVLMFWLFLYWPLRVALCIRVRIKSIMAAALAMLAFPLAAPLVDLLVRGGRHVLMTRYDYYAYFVSTDLRTFIAAAVIACLGAFLLIQLAYVAVRISAQPRLLRILNSRKSYFIFCVFLFLCIPFMGAGNGQRIFNDVSTLSALTRDIDDLLPYLLAVGCILLINRLNRADAFAPLAPEIIKLGGLLFAFFLAGRTSNLLFIPVPLLLGWWLFRKFALATQSLPDRERDKSKIVGFLHYKQAAPILKDLRDTLDSKFRKAEMPLADYKLKLGEADAIQKELDGAIPNGEARASQSILGYGPGTGPWQNAMIALRYGLLISIPFQLYSLWHFHEDSSEAYGQFQWLAAILFSVSFWAILSFIFGYFFHLLRGRNGLQKGLVLFICAVVPTIPQRLLGQQPVFKGAHLVEIFEILAFLLILGLFVFDFGSLKQCGFQWSDLITAHGLTTLTGYATSVVVTTLVGLAGPELKSAISIILAKIWRALT